VLDEAGRAVPVGVAELLLDEELLEVALAAAVALADAPAEADAPPQFRPLGVGAPTAT
jgi:hypothetical protein